MTISDKTILLPDHCFQLTTDMTSSRPPLWRSIPISACLLWLGLLSGPSHALTMGDLAVSSRPSPSFNASLPFSDDKPVRLSKLQTRIATDAEYAQWGLQMHKDVRQLRIRVVPASKTVGYIELYSLSPLTQDSFDLLVWASYAGQTMLTRYKVVLLDMPSLIKGKTLSASSATQTQPQQTNTTHAKAKKAKAPPVNEPASQALSTSEPETSSPNTPTPPENVEATASENVTPDIRTAASETTPPAAALVATSEPASDMTDQTPSWTDRGLGISAWVIASSAILFLFGFLMGRRRNRAAPVSAPSRTSHDDTARHDGTLVAHPSTTKSTPMTPVAVASPSTAIQQESIAEASAPGVQLAVSRPSATALPTPGLLASRGRPIKRQQIKSAGNANIDLAKIYLSMGEPSTAQMVLQQVMEEGTEAERAAARQLLQEMV